MHPFWKQIWLAIRDWYVLEAERLADGIQFKGEPEGTGDRRH